MATAFERTDADCCLVLVTPNAHEEAITQAIDEVTGGAAHPAQTIVGITGLAVPGCLIEIECTAVTSSGAA